jgi:hypothetical protein
MTLDPALTTRPLNVPAAGAPDAVREALEAREARRQDYQRASRAVREAQAGQAEAARLDLISTADSRDRGEPDPPAIHQESARRELEKALHDEEVERLRLERSHDALRRAITAHAEQWARSASQGRGKADARAEKALAQLRQAEGERIELRRALGWLEQLAAGVDLDRLARKGSGVISTDSALPDARNAGRQLTIHELHDAVAAYLDETTEDAEDQRAAQREAQEAEDERRREEIRGFRQAHPGIPLPDRSG